MTTPDPVNLSAAGFTLPTRKIVGKWFGNTISEATAFAAGLAIGPLLGPPVQALKNATWSTYPDMPPDAGMLAEGVAQGQVDPKQAATWAAEHGFSQKAFDALVNIANTGPGAGYAFDLWRRTIIDKGGFERALLRLGIEQEWIDALVKIHDTLLSSQELANLQQQGFIDATRANQEGGLQGVTSERQQLRFEASGLPPGIAEGLEMLRRGIEDDAGFTDIVREGHTKTKYVPQLLQLRYRVLSHLQYVEARVRGWTDNAGMYAGGKLTGYQPEDLDLLHRIHGRPISWHQVWIGLQRGGKRIDAVADNPPEFAEIDPDFLAALRQSDIQQQWYLLAWKQRYSYPSAFVLKQLATSGDIDGPTLRETLKFIGWEPTFIDKIVTAWTGTTTTATQKKQTLSHLTDEYLSGALTAAQLTNLLTTTLGYSADQAAHEIALAEFNSAKAERTRATRALEKRFVGASLSTANARAGLAQLGLPAAAIDQKLNAWTIERADALTTLTVGQIEKAIKAGVLDAATATPLLQELGEDAAAIQTILATYGL